MAQHEAQLSADALEDLRRFRAEAAALLEIKDAAN
jgi:hypothetical protein